LTTALGLAKLGHSVVGVEVNPKKLELLNSGKLPFYEPQLDSELFDSLRNGRLQLTASIKEAADGAEFFFICVSTPQDHKGAADLSFVLSATRDVSKYASPESVIVVKSTVPVGTSDFLNSSIDREDIVFASNPEFLREGSALRDFMEPDRIIVGADSPEVANRLLEIYDNISAPKISTSIKSAELIKYAANAYLASRISFVNDLAALCEQVGAAVDDVVSGMGSDSRIGKDFLKPGPGWGGSCFPKDTRALVSVANRYGVSLGIVEAAIQSNDNSFSRVVTRIKSLLGDDLIDKRIAVWGIAFKANTDDTRDSPSLEVIQRLLSMGCQISAYDPKATAPEFKGLIQTDFALDAARDADALLVLTEWGEFSQQDPSTVASVMKGSVVLDTRRILPMESWNSIFDSFNVLGKG
jgi:UDPglucose 6-dehydrogenase